jgi:hypothetical protein
MIEVARRAAEKAGSTLEDLGDGLYRMPASSMHGDWNVLVTFDEPAKVCAVFSVLPDAVPPERRADMAQFLCDRNYYLVVGAFEMDLDDGEVRLRTSLDTKGAAFDEALFTNIMAANLTMFERHLVTLRQIAVDGLELEIARRRFD